MNKKLQSKDSEKKSANVQRTASYRLALRRSAPPTEAEELLTTNEIKDNSLKTESTVVTSQPTNNKKVSIESNDVQKEPLITDHKTNGENELKSLEIIENNTTEEDNVCTKYCCLRLCCNYCKCCPNCCSLQMKKLETLLIHITDCGLNCLRVFT